jgi:hypothetical protein
MITSIEDPELHENIHQNVSLYELLRNDIEGKEKDSCDINANIHDKTVCFIPGNEKHFHSSNCLNYIDYGFCDV